MPSSVPPSKARPASTVDGLLEAAYDELHRQAQRYLRRERTDHTLQPTALVNEAYLQLAVQKRTDWQGRAHFLGVAGLLMRRILRDYARGLGTERRGGGARKVLLEDIHAITGGSVVEFMAIEEALAALSKLDPEAVKVVEMRFFGGLSIEETASEMQISPATVKRHWVVAKAYLNQQLRERSR